MGNGEGQPGIRSTAAPGGLRSEQELHGPSTRGPGRARRSLSLRANLLKHSMLRTQWSPPQYSFIYSNNFSEYCVPFPHVTQISVNDDNMCIC